MHRPCRCRLTTVALALLPLAVMLVSAPFAFGQDLSIKVVTVTSPVRAGTQAALTIHTTPGAQCTPSVQSQTGTATVKVFPQKRAESNGMVTWSWLIPAGTPAGAWPVVVTCVASGQQVEVRTTTIVQ